MDKKREQVRQNVLKLFMRATAFIGFFMAGGCYCYAADIARKAAAEGLDAIFWVGIVILAVALIGCAMKKAWVQAVIILVFGALVLFVIKHPGVIEQLGNNLGNKFFFE